MNLKWNALTNILIFTSSNIIATTVVYFGILIMQSFPRTHSLKPCSSFKGQIIIIGLHVGTANPQKLLIRKLRTPLETISFNLTYRAPDCDPTHLRASSSSPQQQTGSPQLSYHFPELVLAGCCLHMCIQPRITQPTDCGLCCQLGKRS